MPVDRTVTSRQSRRLSAACKVITHQQHDDDEWETQELLYPDSDSQTAKSSSSSTHAPADPIDSCASASRSRAKRIRLKGHIPRPPNSFMCFRSEYCDRNNEALRAAGTNFCDVSKTAGRVWKQLPDHVRARYEALAEEKKRLHKIQYPAYTYAPGGRPRGSSTGRKAKGTEKMAARKAAADDSDYSDRVVRQSKKHRAIVDMQISPVDTTPPALRRAPATIQLPSLVLSAGTNDRAMLTPELSPGAESFISDPELELPTPVSGPSFSHPAADVGDVDADNFSDFVPTSEIPPLDLDSREPWCEADKTMTAEKDLTFLGSLPSTSTAVYALRPSSISAVGSQFFKPEISRETREGCMWYSADGCFNSAPQAVYNVFTADGRYIDPRAVSFSTPPVVAPADLMRGCRGEEFGVMPINYDEVQFTNPFALAGFEMDVDGFIEREHRYLH